jgi:Fe2+ or Zn2+ uptake regulation protein
MLKQTPSTASDRTLHAYSLGPVYHNTTSKTGEDLEKAELRASGQTWHILKVFKDYPNLSFTPWDIYDKLERRMMITSIRRAITTLTDGGYLVKTGERRKSGPANETNHVWKLNQG